MSEQNIFPTQLPREVLVNIAVQLPADSVLNLIQVCRKLQETCDIFTVWKKVVLQSPNFRAADIPSFSASDQTLWKKYAVADAKAGQGVVSINATLWLPHMMALRHSILSSIEPDILRNLSDPLSHDPTHTPPQYYPEIHPFRFVTNPKSCSDISVWRKAQMHSFCVAARLLSYTEPSDTVPNIWQPDNPLLRTVWWFLIDPTDPAISSRDLERLVVMLHTYANQAVGYFAQELRLAISQGRTGQPSMNGLYFPPTAFSIPFPSFMDLPVPFESGNLPALTTCHLRTMAKPEFFTEGEWTGWLCLGNGSRIPAETGFDSFHGYGADNDTVPLNQWPFPIERTFKFNLVRWDDSETFILRSCYVQSMAWIEEINLKVNTRTGLIDIGHREEMGANLGDRSAVLTPFGILEGCALGGAFVWLWKCGWSELVI